MPLKNLIGYSEIIVNFNFISHRSLYYTLLRFTHDKARTHKEGMRIDKTLKKLDSICCPQRRETKAATLKQLRPIEEGDQELEKRLV
jgi:hypothetical protein